MHSHPGSVCKRQLCCFRFQFEKEEQAVATRKALHGARWPQSNPKTLRVDYADKEEVS